MMKHFLLSLYTWFFAPGVVRYVLHFQNGQKVKGYQEFRGFLSESLAYQEIMGKGQHLSRTIFGSPVASVELEVLNQKA